MKNLCQKDKKTYDQKGGDSIFEFAEVKGVRKIPPSETSTTICKIPQNFVITPPNFFVDAINERHLTLKPTVNITLLNVTICKWVKT